MKKLFTLAAALLASFSLMAETETNPAEVPAKDNPVVGTSYTIPGTINAGPGNKVEPMTSKGVKFRMNKTVSEIANAIEFDVNEGYVISAIEFTGFANDNSKVCTLINVYVDGEALTSIPNVVLPVKTSTPVNFAIDGFNAVEKIILQFSSENLSSQACIEYTVTYEEGSSKQIISTTEELINAKVNGVALDPNFLSELIDTKSVDVFNAYTTAPTVTFTKHVVITYDDESTKESDVDVEVVAEALGSNQWTANITLNGADNYSITMQRAAAYTVTYKMKDGDEEIVLGTEVVAAGGHPAEYAQYEVRPLCSFNGWRDGDYIEEVDMTQVVVNSDMSFYADFDKAYAGSVDFEGMVIINGKSYDVKSALDANFYDYKTIDALDSLNNSKGAARNEPYLGLKIKKNGGYLACNVLPGTTIRIKFGYVAETVLAIAGGDTLRLVPTDNKIADLEFPIMVETLVKLQTTSDKTVVIKQIMINQPLVTWMYPITYAAAEHGTVSGWTIAFPNETVELTVTPEDGYKAASVTAGNEVVVPVENVYSFVMPGQEVTVSATFDVATAIDNTEATVKAVKVVRDGQLFIQKNGVLYNAQGAIVK